MASLVRLRAVVNKETWEIVRDPITLGIAILLPLAMMFLYAYAITPDVKEIRVAVLDEDGSPESREYVASFLQSGYFAFTRRSKTSLRSRACSTGGRCGSPS